MNTNTADLASMLTLEQLEKNLYRGFSREVGTPNVFGGQVLGQALYAAGATLDLPAGQAPRHAHSLHAYFLLPGDKRVPIIYDVDRSRDGGSFSSRRVVAIQNGQQIFHMSASFQIEQAGLDHQIDMPEVPPPEAVPDIRDLIRAATNVPEELNAWFRTDLPYEFRVINAHEYISDISSNAPTKVWFRATARLPETRLMQQCALAYASDFFLLRSTVQPHGIPFPSMHLRMATIDHAMWFHRPFEINDWLLYVIDSPSASGSRGLARGEIFNRQGVLVASVAQEGLIRLRQ